MILNKKEEENEHIQHTMHEPRAFLDSRDL